MMASNGMRPAIGLNCPRDIFRYGSKHSYLDEVFVKYPSTQCAIELQTGLVFPARLVNEHALISVTLEVTKYANINDSKLVEHSSLNRIHPAAAEAHELIGRVEESVVGPDPIQVQKQIRAIVAAADIRHASKQLPSAEQIKSRN